MYCKCLQSERRGVTAAAAGCEYTGPGGCAGACSLTSWMRRGRRGSDGRPLTPIRRRWSDSKQGLIKSPPDLDRPCFDALPGQTRNLKQGRRGPGRMLVPGSPRPLHRLVTRTAFLQGRPFQSRSKGGVVGQTMVAITTAVMTRLTKRRRIPVGQPQQGLLPWASAPGPPPPKVAPRAGPRKLESQ